MHAPSRSPGSARLRAERRQSSIRRPARPAKMEEVYLEPGDTSKSQEERTSDGRQLTIPKGEKITIDHGKLRVRTTRSSPSSRADGTGPDIWRAVGPVLDAAWSRLSRPEEDRLAETYAGEEGGQGYGKTARRTCCPRRRSTSSRIPGGHSRARSPHPSGGLPLAQRDAAGGQVLDLYVLACAPVKYSPGRALARERGRTRWTW